jgi:hypothetical protein
MQPETQGQSHQISNISIGPDGKLYVHMGDGFDAARGQDLTSFRGKVLRMNLDGSVPSDNPFYSALNGITATDYVYAYGLRNPFGGAWRAADGKHYEVENGPSVDRLARIDAGRNYLYDGSDASMFNFAIYNWIPAHAPVNIAFVQSATFGGSQFPSGKLDHAFVSESGPTYADGPQANGKRIVEFVFDANGGLVSGPTTLVEYVGTGQGTVVGLAAGPDGLYFTELYEDSGANGPTAAGARIFRVRYENPLLGDYDIDGDVDNADYDVWVANFGSTLLLAADGNGNGVVDAADYSVWRDHLGATLPGAGSATAPTVENAVPAASIPAAAQTPGDDVASSADSRVVITERPNSQREAAARYVRRRASIGLDAGGVHDRALLAVLDGGQVYRARETSVTMPAKSETAQGESADLTDELFAEFEPQL